MKFANGLKITAIVIAGLAFLFWLVLGIGQIARGNWNAIYVLIPVLVAGALAWLGLRRPLLAGILLALLGVVLAVYYLLVFYSIQEAFVSLACLCAPLCLSGLLLIEADWKARKAGES